VSADPVTGKQVMLTGSVEDEATSLLKTSLPDLSWHLFL
jgi:hypothetical protein